VAVKKKKTKKKASRKGGRGRRVLMLLMLILLLAGGGAVAYILKGQKAEVPIQAGVALAAGMRGAGPGGLDSPRGISVAPDGKVYVADLSNARIAVFGKDGAFIRNFGKAGAEPGKAKEGEFNEPSGVAVGPDGSVYVADAWNGRIQKLSADGKPITEFGGGRYSFYSPRNVFVDKAGNIYVADTGNSTVKVIAPDGKLIKALGGRGSGGGQFNEVFGVAVNSKGEVFICDAGNKKVHKFSALPAGEFVKAVKVPGWQSASPFWPHVACDAQDNVYVVDPGNRKIWVYNSDLAYEGTLGGPQAGELFASPLGIAFGPDNALWVGDVANNKVLKLAPFTVPAAQ
jgi:DNA-binding beta-propeller fold protein YncE